MTAPGILQAVGLALDAPCGRPLLRDLTLQLDAGDRVALVGRNGAGKSSLLAVLAGAAEPNGGRVTCAGRRVLVPQRLAPESATAESPGERRRQHLVRARDARPDVLLLDEPTRDLDAQGRSWLFEWLCDWPGTLVVVSHDRELLRAFRDFFIVAESGCTHRSGSFEALQATLRGEQEERERRHVQRLHQLLEQERHRDAVLRRWARKRNLGRLHELGRGTPRMRLNAKRSYAQEKQGRRAGIQRDRIEAARAWVQAARRALAVELPLELALPALPSDPGRPIAVLEHATSRVDGRVLFRDISLSVARERLAVTGPNGAGKSTLLEIVAGRRRPEQGRARCDASRIGYLGQSPELDDTGESLLDRLASALAPDTCAGILRAHGFPFALAERPLASLSPGERLRALLIELFQRRPAPELLVLDEPTADLDLPGLDALETVLAAWRGGLVVASHDADFLQAIGVHQTLELGAPRGASAIAEAPLARRR